MGDFITYVVAFLILAPLITCLWFATFLIGQLVYQTVKEIARGEE